MRYKIIFLQILFVLLSNPIFSQNDAKIEKKLNKLFVKEKYDKCYEKAFKLNKKYRKSDVPEFYISKVEIKLFSNPELSETKKYKHLKNAVRYSHKLGDNYSDWVNEVKDIYKSHILSIHDSTKISHKCKSALAYYTRTYKDTLEIYSYYFPKKISKKEVSQQKKHLSKSDSLRNELLRYAEKQEGVKYWYTGIKPETGFDCSGFTLYAYEHIGIKLPHNAHLQSKLKGENKTLEEAKPGDLIFFGSRNGTSYRTQHAGIIYSTDGEIIKVIHCVSNGVSIDGKNSSWEHYWKDKVLFVKSLPELNQE